MMTPVERTQLERNKLFRDISLESVGHILEDCQAIALRSGEKLLEIGQKNNSLYLVLEGELHVCLGSRDLNEHAVLGSGECVGELSLIDGGNTSARVIAARDTRLLVVPYDHVWLLVDSSNGVARNLLGILAGRIRNDNLLLVTTHEQCLEFEVAANVDALTGLHNRSWMDEAFPRMILRCQRSKAPLCMLMTGIDHFKNFNNIHGHLAGDSVLKIMARLMAEKMRSQDLLAYMGGDRFVILLPETPPDIAMKIAERLREAVAAASLVTGASDAPHAVNIAPITQDTHITVSISITVMQSDDTLDSISATAAETLCQAKVNGRNQVKMAVTGSLLRA